jgi:hypothetical protein
MRTVLVALLVIACLVVIAIPALIAAPVTPQATPRPERDVSRQFHFEGAPIWMRLSPFGAHTGGWQGILSAAASWVYLYITSVLMLALMPHRVRLVTQALKSGGWRERGRLFLIGLLATLASVLLVVLARFAFVWFVLVILLVGGMLVLSFLGVIGASLMVGEAVRKWARFAPSLWVELALGSLILFAFGHIPVAGWILVGIVVAWGLGAVLATHLGSGEAWSLQDLKATD